MMKHFILDSEPEPSGKIRFTGKDYHYLVRVRRLAPGEYFPGLLPSGKKVLIHVDSVDGNVLIGALELQKDSREEKNYANSAFPDIRQQLADIPPLILFQAIPKGDKMDIIVRQAAEGGLAEIVPFISEFSVPRPEKQSKAAVLSGGGTACQSKVTRWKRIVKEARQQSGSAIATLVREIMQINEIFTYWEKLKEQYPGALALVLHQIPLEHGGLHGYLETRPELIVAAIGPEGGFSPHELNRFMEAGFKPVTIGNNVLRTETAAVYAAAAIRIVLQERNSWEKSRK